MISAGSVYVPSQLDSWKEHFRNNNIFEFDLRFNGEVTVEENSSWRVLPMKQLAGQQLPAWCGILKVRSRSGVLKECTAAGSYWVRDVAAVCLRWLFVAHGADCFTGLALKHASSANVYNSRLFMSTSNGGGGGDKMCLANLNRMLYWLPSMVPG